MSELENIIARLETITGPDRELDLAIFDATNERAHERYGRELLPWAHRYTASIDAALTLVATIPVAQLADHEKCEIQLQFIDGEYCNAVVSRDTFDIEQSYHACHRYAAIALCIAALRARAALTNTEGA